MDLEWLAALTTGEGPAALAAAATLAPGDPLAAAAAMRALGYPAELTAAALTQIELRRRAAAKFGPDAAAMLFTRDGLEQATRPLVAARRAARLVAHGVRSVADLGCGIGADAIAFARSGLQVRAVEVDPLTAQVARANAAALGLGDRIGVSTMDATEAPLDGVDAVFCDPARRTTGRTGDGRRGGTGRRVFDPARYAPPWSFVATLPARVPKTVLKLAPGIDHALVPPGAEAQWTSVGGDVVEATFWCGPLSGAPRRATVLPRTGGGRLDPGVADLGGTVGSGTGLGAAAEITGSGTAHAPVGPLRRYLVDPDGAVVRAHLVAEFAESVDGTLADSAIAYVYTDREVRSPLGRCLEVTDILPVAVKRLRAALRVRGIGRLTIMKRGSVHDPDRLRRTLRLSGDEEATLVLTRVANAPTALLCRA